MLDFSTYKHGNECLAIFCRADMPLELETLKEKLGLSRRSLMYLFKHLNEELQEQGLPGLSNLKGQGYILSPEAKAFLQQGQGAGPRGISLTEPEKWRFALRQLREEESLHLLVFVLITRQSTSLRELAEIFQGARNTLLRLLGRLQDFLGGSNLTVLVTPKGRCMEGEERARRKWVLENLETLLRVFRRFGLQPREDFLEALKDYEKESGNRFTQDARQLLGVYLPWYAARLASGHRLKSAGKRGQEQEPAALWAQKFLAGLGVKSSGEVGYLIEVLNFFAFSKLDRKHERYEEMHRIAEEMTEQFFGLSGFEPGSNHLVMIDSLAVHLVSAWHRLTAGVNYHNPMLEQIKSRYQNLFVISKAASRPFAEYLGRELPEDELALLTTYFGSDIRTEEMEGEKRQILVVCSSGIGTSQFLLMQLREKYPRLLFSGPFRVSDLGDLSLREAGLILTTTELGELAPPRVPLCQISPLPDKYEWEMLEQRLVSLGFETGDYGREKVEHLLDIIAGFAKIQDEEGLRQSLQQYFRESGRGRPRGTASDSLLKYTEVLPESQAGWREAVRLSFRPLVAHHFVESRYVERIIQLTEKQGEYMLLGRGLLLAHARPEDGVLEPAVAVAVFASGVKLDSGKEVRCIICLAPADKSAHLDFLTALLEHINTPGWCERLCGAGTQAELDEVLADFL